MPRAALLTHRRNFLLAGMVLGSSSPGRTASSETVYRLAVADCDISMAVEFFDGYSTKGFWLREQTAQRSFCLSGSGRENALCLPGFAGSIAIARYHVRSHSQTAKEFALIERVRVIDQDSRLPSDPPFERRIDVKDGVASDLQAFGYDSEGAPADQSGELANRKGPWRLLRQDLFLRAEEPTFLVLHWKHALTGIRLFDVIPGERTSIISEPDAPNRKVR